MEYFCAMDPVMVMVSLHPISSLEEDPHGDGTQKHHAENAEEWGHRVVHVAFL